MADYSFVEFPNLDTWVIFATGRSSRPHTQTQKNCPFCPGNEHWEEEVYRVGGSEKQSDWTVRVITNKFPFAPIHEVVIHTPTHCRNFGDLPLEQTKFVLETFVNRYNTHREKGSVVIFGNSGRAAGESIMHPHSQIAVVPPDIRLTTPKLEGDMGFYGEHFDVKGYSIVCPPYSQWPDELWIVPERRHKNFGQIEQKELEGLALILQRLVRLFEARHEGEFPHNFYIYPYNDWYVRIIPRNKTRGGFEMATEIMVNTQDPRETMAFVKEYFYEDNMEKIKPHTAKYRRGV